MRIAAMTGTMLAVGMLAGCATGAPTAKVGECLDIAVGQSTVTELARVACTQEHDAEVYLVQTIDLEAFDAAAVAQEAQCICRDAFYGFVGATYEESILDIYMLYPQQQSWDGGDREVICAVYKPDREQGRPERLSSSLEDSRL